MNGPFNFSKHCLVQMQIRNITKTEVDGVLAAPDKIIEETNEQLIYQKLINN